MDKKLQEISHSDSLQLSLQNQSESISIESDEQIEKIVKALSSHTRRQILHHIQMEPMDVSNIASSLKMTEANISAQIKKLEEAGLISCDYESGNHGVRKISKLKLNISLLYIGKKKTQKRKKSLRNDNIESNEYGVVLKKSKKYKNRIYPQRGKIPKEDESFKIV